MNEKVEDLTIEREENGQIIVRELDKAVLSKGSWATVLYRCQMWQPETDDYGPDRYIIERYRKSGGEYKRQSKFNISSPEQARKIVDALSRWLDDAGDEA